MNIFPVLESAAKLPGKDEEAGGERTEEVGFSAFAVQRGLAQDALIHVGAELADAGAAVCHVGDSPHAGDNQDIAQLARIEVDQNTGIPYAAGIEPVVYFLASVKRDTIVLEVVCRFSIEPTPVIERPVNEYDSFSKAQSLHLEWVIGPSGTGCLCHADVVLLQEIFAVKAGPHAGVHVEQLRKLCDVERSICCRWMGKGEAFGVAARLNIQKIVEPAFDNVCIVLLC